MHSERGEAWGVVTAGVHGLGRAISERLAADGLSVMATTRHPGAASAAWAAGVSEQSGVLVRVVAWDPARPDSDAGVLERLRQDAQAVRVLVNNAGPFHRRRQPLADVAPEALAQLWEGNVAGGMRLTQQLLPWLRARGDGRIVNLGCVGSGAASGWTGRGAYAAAKAAVASLTRTWALEEAPYGITANMVCPSDVHARDKERADFGRHRPHGADVAELVAFFAGPGSRFVTGQVVEMAFGDRPRLKPGERTLSPAADLLPQGAQVRLAREGEIYEVVDVRTEGAAVEYLVRPPVGEPRWVAGSRVRRLVGSSPP